MTAKILPFYQVVDGFRIPGILSAEAYKTALNYKPRPDDFFIATFPKCGTTWTQQIVALIFNNGKPVADFVEFSARTPFLELTGAEGAEKMIRPGSIKVHLPFNMTPYSPESKYMYVVRNPKDALVSFFHHTRSYIYKFEDGDFNDYFELFINGQTDFGDYFDHVLSWYEHRNDPNVLFVCYEELKKDTPKTVKKIASFMGKEYEDLLENEAVLSDVLKYSSIDYMKTVINESLEAMSVNLNASMIDDESVPAGLKHFNKKMVEFKSTHSKQFELIRKGNVGGWRDSFTADQNHRMDVRLQEKLGDTYLYKYWKSINCI